MPCQKIRRIKNLFFPFTGMKQVIKMNMHGHFLNIAHPDLPVCPLKRQLA